MQRLFGDVQRYTDRWVNPDPSTELSNFIDRMRVTRRSFLVEVPSGSTTAIEAVAPTFTDDPDEAVEEAQRQRSEPLTDEMKQMIRERNESLKAQWTDCCKRDYVQRQKKFRERFQSPSGMYRSIAIAVLAVALCIWFAWPLWNILIDVESGDHYKILNISPDASPAQIRQAFRAMVKQWHPDHNPNCGDKCRHMMMRLQEAHDVLLARGDQRDTLAAKYRDALSQLRAILYFRVYDIGFYNAEFFGSLLLIYFSVALSKHKATVRVVTRATSIVLFLVVDMMFLSGLNILVLLQMFYFLVNTVRQAAQMSELEKIIKRSNFDITRDFVYFLVPAVLMHAAGWWLDFSSRNGPAEFLWHAVIGVSYLAAHLAKFSPNLFDNFSLRKCSLSIPYLQASSGLQFTLSTFAWAEFSFLLDDVIIFSSHCPSVYRVVVWAVHLTYLAQMWFLPWDSPVKGKLHKRRDEAASAESSARQQPPKSSSSAPVEEKARTLLPWELKMLEEVDKEPCLWFDLVLLKYRHALATAAGSSNTKPEDQKLRQVVLVASEDCTEVLLCVLTQKPGTQDGTREIRNRFKDPATAQLLAREVGLNGVLWFEKHRPPPGLQPSDLTEKYNKLVPMPELLSTNFFAMEPVHIPRATVCGVLLAVGCVCLCVCSLTWSPLVDKTPTHETEPLFTARPNRYRQLLAADHVLNKGAGPVRAADGNTALLALDVYEFLRQFEVFYQSEEERANDQRVQRASEGSTDNQQRRKKAKQRENRARGSK